MIYMYLLICMYLYVDDLNALRAAALRDEVNK